MMEGFDLKLFLFDSQKAIFLTDQRWGRPCQTTRTGFAKSWTEFAKGKIMAGLISKAIEKKERNQKIVNHLRISIGALPNSLLNDREK